MAYWAADATSTTEASYTTTAEEAVSLAFDVTALLVDADPATDPEAVLYRVVDNGADVAVDLDDAPTVDGAALIQRLAGLTAATTYRLRLSFLTSGNRRALTLIVVVVE